MGVGCEQGRQLGFGRRKQRGLLLEQRLMFLVDKQVRGVCGGRQIGGLQHQVVVGTQRRQRRRRGERREGEGQFGESAPDKELALGPGARRQRRRRGDDLQL